jgi:hypothetical protein
MEVDCRTGARHPRPAPLYRHALSYEILEDKPSAFEVRVTECLWAKTFRGAGAP